MVIGILGATGCVGALLLTYLLTHPHVKKIYATSESGEETGAPHMRYSFSSTASAEFTYKYHSLEEVRKLCENNEIQVLFSALPHGRSAKIIHTIANKNKNIVVIDLSADFRYSDAALYKRIYGKEHVDTKLLKYAVYGLSEWNREFIQKARIIACPGSYPTSVLLALLPVLRYVKPTGIISIAASLGTSDVGKKCKSHLLFTEHKENIVPYAVGTQHCHVSEIIHQLARLAHLDKEIWNNNEENINTPLVFIPQLAPIAHGILAVITVPLASQDVPRAAAVLTAQYVGETWVSVYEENTMPEIRHVRGTNNACIGYRCETSSLILCCAIDGLGKGAAGQAVQNFNIRYGFSESLCLPETPVQT